jgi:hypothetical protein
MGRYGMRRTCESLAVFEDAEGHARHTAPRFTALLARARTRPATWHRSQEQPKCLT